MPDEKVITFLSAKKRVLRFEALFSQFTYNRFHQEGYQGKTFLLSLPHPF